METVIKTEDLKEMDKTKSIKIALVGNPNVGKSVFFNYFTGVYVDVSNYPGTTIEISSAALKLSKEEQEKLGNRKLEIIDTPGVYGISSFNDEEIATRDFVLDADIIINVVSAVTLERDLFLSKQLADMGKPMIIALNQIDEARARKVAIDIKTLSERLGTKVIPTVAIKQEGLELIKNDILIALTKTKKSEIAPGKLSADIEILVEPYLEKIFSRAEALMILEGDKVIAERNKEKLPENIEEIREKVYTIRRREVNEIVLETVSKVSFSKRVFFGNLLLNPIFGSIFGVIVLYLFLYQFLGIFVAGSVVEITEGKFMAEYYEPFTRNLVSKIVPILYSGNLIMDGASANLDLFPEIRNILGALSNILITNPKIALGTFLAGDYGVLTLTIRYLYGLLLPLVIGFYAGLAILEDSGYLPRLAVLVDGVLTKLGMNGRAIVPLILGGGCVTMATVTTRLLSTRKEKLITIALLGLTIPCSAQLGVIQGLLSNIGGFLPWLIWGSTLLLIFILVGTVLNKALPGPCGDFLTDIPPLRLPRLENIWKKTYTRTKVFMDEATVPFFIAAALVAGLQVTGLLQSIIDLTEPIISNILLLPKEAALSFILGMVRRDFGAFGLLDIEMSASQLVTACTVLTIFVPCIATVAVTVKEGSFKTAMAIWVSSWILSFTVGGIMARVLLQVF